MTIHIKRISITLLAYLYALIVVGCGGAGSTDVVLPKTGVALSTNAGTAITLAPGQNAQFSISGGGGGSTFTSYDAASSNLSVATVTVSGSTMSVTGIAKGTGSIVVNDSAGNTVSIAVTVASSSSGSGALTLIGPQSLTMAAGTVSSAYPISGGSPPYLLVASNYPAVAIGTISNNQLTVSGLTAGSASLAIFDSAGASITLGVTITGTTTQFPLYIAAPLTINLPVGSMASYMVGGGAGGYLTSSGSPAIAAASIAGNMLTITGLRSGSSQIAVTDSTGSTQLVTVNVVGTTAVALYTTAPTSLSIASNSSQTFLIGGGIGPYLSTSGNISSATVSVSGGSLTITGVAAGAAQVFIFDSTGKALTIAVTVTP